MLAAHRLWFFLKNIYRYRAMIAAMTRRELRQRYVGTLGGVSWAIINPILMTTIYWAVFSLGLKVQLVGNVPFVLFFLCGLAPWAMFAETTGTSAGVILANSHLVSKVVFPTEILPIVQLGASLVSHLLVVVVVVVMLVFRDAGLPWTVIQLVYYSFAAMVFTIGVGWICASVNVFFRDIGQMVPSTLNLWFWLTPIVWSADLVPPRLQWLLMFNPLHYVVQGYRDSLLFGIPLWSRPVEGLVFWLECLVVLGLGVTVFRRLKPEFAEVM